MSTYDTTPFQPGQRVALHPATDAWMSGDRFGTVSSVRGRWLYVRMDKTDRVLRLIAGLVTHVNDVTAEEN